MEIIMEITISTRGDEREAGAVLRRLGDALTPAIARGLPLPESPIGEWASGTRLSDFVSAAGDPGLNVLQAIAEASLADRPIERSALIERAGKSNELGLRTLIGNIGKAWKKHCGGRNPFLAEKSMNQVFYRVDKELARALLPVVEERLEQLKRHGQP